MRFAEVRGPFPSHLNLTLGHVLTEQNGGCIAGVMGLHYVRCHLLSCRKAECGQRRYPEALLKCCRVLSSVHFPALLLWKNHSSFFFSLGSHCLGGFAGNTEGNRVHTVAIHSPQEDVLNARGQTQVPVTESLRT